MSTTPNRIGRYELEQYLGGGGMSAVYRALDPQMGRRVALKILKETYRPDDPNAQRFVVEVQIAGSLNHENVIRTYDFGFDPEGRPFMVLEYVEGEDLQQAIGAGRTGSLPDRARIGVQLADALEYIHPRNVVHRDLKPANVYLSTVHASGPQVKLMDFGIARTDSAALTQAGMIVGTPSYMAPEQVQGERDLSRAVDIYAFGVVMWEVFTGERAFSGDTVQRVFYRVLNEELDLEKLRRCGLAEELVQQIGKCAAKEAWKRPADLQGVRLELLRLANPGLTASMLAPPSQTPTVVVSAVGAPPARAAVAAAGPKPVPPQAAPGVPGVPAGDGKPRWLWPAVGGGVAVALVAGVLIFSGGGGGGGRVQPKGKSGAALELKQTIDSPAGTMVLVPAGAFLFGKAKESVDLPAFYIDKTEVTNRAYADFARATGATLPPGFSSDRPDLPVVNITLAEAQAFADWAGKSLPTSKQWEKAARGIDGRTYPWGEAAEASRANVGLGKSGSLAPADGFPAGASPFQVLQTVGNAWEWVDDTDTPSAKALSDFAAKLTPPLEPGERWVKIRGGSYLERLDPAVMYDKVAVPARHRDAWIGFRCVKPARAE